MTALQSPSRPKTSAVSVGDTVAQSMDLAGPEREASRGGGLSKILIGLLLGSALYRLLLAAFVTDFVLVDDAYIHLRYARNLVEHGSFTYNAGEAVFGLTSPLYGLLTAVLYRVFGTGVEVAVITGNIVLWTAAGALLARELPRPSRMVLLSLFLLAPVFVDNQLLGMETPLFVFLLVGASHAARRGSVVASALWFGPALITRPEAVLLVPFLLLGVAQRHGLLSALKRLVQPKAIIALLGPGVAWGIFAISTYGSIIPQSMVAKSGWNSEHYEGLLSVSHAFLTVPRLTFLPFIDYFPMGIQWGMTGTLLLGIGWVAYRNVRQGTRASRAWLGFYLTYLGFYIAGKGATEASWYAVPSSVALLCAAAPALPGWLTNPRRPAFQWALVCALLLMSTAASIQRAPLLKSYVNGYGGSAEFLEGHSDSPWQAPVKVVIGEIGVFGFNSSLSVVDVAALVSPEVLPWKNAGFSFVRIVQEAGAGYFVISDRALELNTYPQVGAVWANETERKWLESNCRPIAQHLDKNTYEVLAEPTLSAR